MKRQAPPARGQPASFIPQEVVMKLMRALLAGLLFLLTLLLVYGLHIQLFKVDVVFYAALGDVLLAAALTALGLYTGPGFGCWACSSVPNCW
jgi:hypothetical protein